MLQSRGIFVRIDVECLSYDTIQRSEALVEQRAKDKPDPLCQPLNEIILVGEQNLI